MYFHLSDVSHELRHNLCWVRTVSSIWAMHGLLRSNGEYRASLRFCPPHGQCSCQIPIVIYYGTQKPNDIHNKRSDVCAISRYYFSFHFPRSFTFISNSTWELRSRYHRIGTVSTQQYSLRCSARTPIVTFFILFGVVFVFRVIFFS